MLKIIVHPRGKEDSREHTYEDYKSMYENLTAFRSLNRKCAHQVKKKNNGEWDNHGYFYPID